MGKPRLLLCRSENLTYLHDQLPYLDGHVGEALPLASHLTWANIVGAECNFLAVPPSTILLCCPKVLQKDEASCLQTPSSV